MIAERAGFMKNTGNVMSGKPRVSIGLPVFNGEKYLKEALDSILAQTYSDFELVISDNASTDRTEQICREYAAKDRRICYYHNEKNIGAPKNFNRVFELSSGEYFKWIAYDDVYAPEFLQKCVAVLDKDPSAVLCHSKTSRIDENGTLVGNYDHRTLRRISSWKPHERFGDLISIRNPCWAVFGVVRASSFKKTPLHGSYIGADRNLLAEIGLMGRIIEIPEHLFFRRDHPEAYTRKFCENKFAISVDNYAEQLAWWSKDDWTNFPNWKDCAEFFRSVNRVPLKWSERLACYNQIFRWFIKEGWFFMGGDIENLLLRRSRLGRKLIPFVKLNLRHTVIPIIKKFRR
ncbi:MAG: glycosyltransferase [Candidatus Bathyarchaeia archaeon]|jgi:glycosyltransferase involved in cell wall biosynthesis